MATRWIVLFALTQGVGLCLVLYSLCQNVLGQAENAQLAKNSAYKSPERG